MDYNLDIPNIYTDAYVSNNKDNILEIIDVDLKELYDSGRLLFYTSKSMFLLIKTNIIDKLIFISDIKIYNNLIYFPDEKITWIKIFSNTNINLDYDKHYIKIYNIQYNTKINKFIKHNNFDYNTYCTGDNYMLIFKNGNLMTFTIHISLNSKKYDKNKLKLIKLKSNDIIFIYNPIFINESNIVLYLIGLQKLNSDEYLNIDIKFNNIDNIYDKYKKSSDDIKKFFNHNDDYDYEIEVKYLEKYIKGVYNPYTIII